MYFLYWRSNRIFGLLEVSCVGPITRPEESYRVWCVCHHKASIMGRPWPSRGFCAIGKNYFPFLLLDIQVFMLVMCDFNLWTFKWSYAPLITCRWHLCRNVSRCSCSFNINCSIFVHWFVFFSLGSDARCEPYKITCQIWGYKPAGCGVDSRWF
jgi:hypothetical protein